MGDRVKLTLQRAETLQRDWLKPIAWSFVHSASRARQDQCLVPAGKGRVTSGSGTGMPRNPNWRKSSCQSHARKAYAFQRFNVNSVG